MRALFYAVVCICLQALVSPAEAQILFAGGEDVDFRCSIGGACNVTTNGNFYYSSLAREAYYVAGNSSDPPVNRFATPGFTQTAAIWVHALFCQASNVGEYCGYGSLNATSSNQQLLRVIDSAGNPTLILRGTGTAGQLKISSRTASGTFTDLVTCANAFAAYGATQLDLYINYGTSGQVTLYTNSNQVCSYSGNLTNGDGAAQLDGVEFAAADASYYGFWFGVIIATSDTRAMSLFTLAPNGNGNATQWTGSNPCTAILNATTINGSNYVYTGSNNQIEECTVRNSIPPGIYAVPAVVMSMSGLVGASGPQHFAFLTRIGTTDYASGSFSPTNSLGNIGNYIQTQNPATGNPWSVTDLTASGFNIGLESEP